MKVHPDILSLVPYKPGKPVSEAKREFGLDEVVKLASNENPFGVSPLVKQALLSAIDELHRYPDPTCFELTQFVANRWGVKPTNLVFGNGSDELFDLLIRIFCEPGDAILIFEKSFVAYEVSAQAARVQTQKVPLEKFYGCSLAKMAEYLRTERERSKIKLVFLPSPNNPTGVTLKKNDIEQFLQEFGNLPDLYIVFDEAYLEFNRDPSCVPALHWFGRFTSVLVARTFSKSYAMAGLRLGALVAPTDCVDLIHRVRKPFNVNELAQKAALAAMQDQEFLRCTVETTWKGLDSFYEALTELQLPFVRGQGNFVFFDTERDATLVFRELLKKGVILRPLTNYGFVSEMRMSVGTERENAIAIQALREVLATLPATHKKAST